MIIIMNSCELYEIFVDNESIKHSVYFIPIDQVLNVHQIGKDTNNKPNLLLVAFDNSQFA